MPPLWFLLHQRSGLELYAWSIINQWAGGKGTFDVVLATHPQNSVHHHLQIICQIIHNGV